MVVAGYEFTVVSSQSEMRALFIHKICFTSPGDFVVIDTLLLRPNSIKKTFGEMSKRVHTWVGTCDWWCPYVRLCVCVPNTNSLTRALQGRKA